MSCSSWNIYTSLFSWPSDYGSTHKSGKISLDYKYSLVPAILCKIFLFSLLCNPAACFWLLFFIPSSVFLSYWCWFCIFCFAWWYYHVFNSSLLIPKLYFDSNCILFFVRRIMVMASYRKVFFFSVQYETIGLPSHLDTLSWYTWIREIKMARFQPCQMHAS